MWCPFTMGDYDDVPSSAKAEKSLHQLAWQTWYSFTLIPRTSICGRTSAKLM